MSLTVGDRIAHYDVTALIGEGGMGQVYQATDTKLNRQVALKILPEALAADPDRLARFQREAQVLASLNHPFPGWPLTLARGQRTRNGSSGRRRLVATSDLSRTRRNSTVRGPGGF